jgi:hypothetical protein
MYHPFLRTFDRKFHFVVAWLAILAAPGVGFAAGVESQKAKASPDGKTLWYDCKDLTVEGKGWSDTASFYDRLPARAEGKVTPPVWDLSHHSAGLCVRFAAIIGRKLDLPVINLGFSGSGKMEPAMADLLAELDPSVYVLDCLWNMSPEMVSTRVEPFVKRLRAARPDTPICLVEDCSVRNVCPTEKGTILRAIDQKLTAAGVKNLHFLSNHGMLGDDTEGTVDGCHPNDLGMMRQAEAFTKALCPLVATKK